jgi:hypothetical protein
MAHFLIWSWFFYITLLVVLCIFGRLFRYPVERLDHLIAVVRTVDDFEIEHLFDARKEAELKAEMTPKEFREEQRQRICQAFEYLRRWGFNGLAITRVAYAAWYAMEAEESPDPVKLCAVHEVIQAGMKFRWYCLGALPKATVWVLLRVDRWPLVMPHVSDLRFIGNTDGMQAYYRLTEAIGRYSLLYGEDIHAALMLRLRGHVPTL